MPGHKRSNKFGISGIEFDITEISDFDNLHAPDGILLDIEERLAAHYNAKKSFMLVNGSTLGILSSIFAVCGEGDKIIIARNCHKSVFNACMLRKLKVVYIEPEFDDENGFYKHITQMTVDSITEKHPDAKALVITSPTYEGYVSDISSPIPLIIDAAHAAHFGLGSFPSYPKGNIVVSSLHKTLPALTQTAVINVYDDSYIERIKRYLDIFETSSPSYLLMNSVDLCLDYIEKNVSDFDDYCKLLSVFHSRKLSKLKIRKNDDLSRIIVSSANTDIEGTALCDILRNEYGIEAEAASKNYIILISTVADDAKALDLLFEALYEIDGSIKERASKPFIKPPCTSKELIISVDDNSQSVAFEESVEKKANEFIFAYPPDIPIIIPGEIISDSTLDYIGKLIKSGVNVISDSGLLPDKILTKADY